MRADSSRNCCTGRRSLRISLIDWYADVADQQGPCVERFCTRRCNAVCLPVVVYFTGIPQSKPSGVGVAPGRRTWFTNAPYQALGVGPWLVAVDPPKDHTGILLDYMKLFRQPLFLGIVAIPNMVCIIYFFLFASPIYVSTASLVVYKSAQEAQSLTTMLSGAGGGNSSEGAFIVKDYIGSWDEYRNVNQAVDLRKHYDQGDQVSRYGGFATLFRNNDVALWHYYQNRVNASIDQNSGIVSLSVEGYSPSTAATIAEKVLQDAVRHIDEMNEQQETDYIRNAVDRRTSIEGKLRSDEATLSAYRVATGMHNPSDLYNSNLALLNTLNEQKTRMAAQFDVISKATPNNPVAQNLRAAMTAIQAKITGTEIDGKALSRQAAHYDELSVMRDNDVALLHEVETAVQQAQLNAMKNKYYLNIISAPSSPHAPELPRRLDWISGVLLATFVVWGLLR